MGVDRRNRDLLVRGKRISPSTIATLADIETAMPADSRTAVDSVAPIANPATADAEDVAIAFNNLLVAIQTPSEPHSLVSPVVTGTLNPTETLTTTAGTWLSQSEFTTAIQWQSTDDDEEGPWADIVDADETTYDIPAESSVGLYYRAQVTATNEIGDTVVYSNIVGPVTEA